MAISNLWQKTLYTIPARFVLGSIFEYDITKANISILLAMNMISIDMYHKLAAMNGIERKINVGLLEKANPDLKQALESGFAEARRLLVMNNDIQDNEIISIKKDALFVTRYLSNTEFGPIHFLHKNLYSMMARIDKIEFYYGYDDISKESVIDIKGIRDDILELHQEGWIPFLCQIFYSLTHEQYGYAVECMVSVLKQYDTLELPIEFYREFNFRSSFKILPTGYSEFYVDRASEQDKASLDISYNRDFARKLYMLVAEIYNHVKRKG